MWYNEHSIVHHVQKDVLIYGTVLNTRCYYIEARTGNNRRTDIIADYKGRRFIIELKIRHGDEYNSRGEKQLFDYLECYKQNKVYLLSFNFNKNKKTGVNELDYIGKKILEVVV